MVDFFNQGNSIFEEALEESCKYIKGDCPKVVVDVEPWGDCNTVCRMDNEHWKCWKQYFINIATEKNNE